MLRLLVSVTLLFGAAPALAEATATQEPAALKEKANERVICRSIEQIGSRLAKKRVCMTTQQWEEHRRGEREVVDDLQQRKSRPGG